MPRFTAVFAFLCASAESKPLSLSKFSPSSEPLSLCVALHTTGRPLRLTKPCNVRRRQYYGICGAHEGNKLCLMLISV